VTTTDMTSRIAEYAVSTSVSAVPDDVLHRARMVLMDELASAYFGSRRTPGQLATRYAASLGGAPENRVFGTGMRLPILQATMANGTAGHADEVDGAHVVGGHPGATIVHAAAAVAERQHSTGAELLNAVILGYDVSNRLIRACGGNFGLKERHGVHADLLHAVGAAVAATRLLGLDAQRTRYAMALSTFQANGFVALFGERRHISKSLCNGQYATAGVSSALMAAVGIEGCEDVLGDPYGLLNAWGEPDAAEVVVRGLGEDFEVMGANIKFVNAGYPIHTVVEATTNLMYAHDIQPEDVVAVEVGMPARAMRVVDNREMHNICVQDMLAATLLERGHSLAAPPFPRMLTHPGFAAMRARITVAVDPDLDRELPNGRGARVRILTTNADPVTERLDWARGHSLRPGLEWSDLSQKWHDALPDADVDRMLTLAEDVEDLDDANALLEAFAG